MGLESGGGGKGKGGGTFEEAVEETAWGGLADVSGLGWGLLTEGKPANCQLVCAF